MSTKKKIAFVIYLLTGLTSIAYAVAYLLCPTIMPYHKEAIGIEWADVPVGIQLLLQALVKVAGAGFLVMGLAVLIISLIPFRRGENWTLWTIPLLVGGWTVPTVYAAYRVSMNTEISTPWWSGAVIMVLVLLALILSVGTQKE